jgi:hypothetical protein
VTVFIEEEYTNSHHATAVFAVVTLVLACVALACCVCGSAACCLVIQGCRACHRANVGRPPSYAVTPAALAHAHEAQPLVVNVDRAGGGRGGAGGGGTR